MFKTRVLVALGLLPLGFGVIYLGGWVFNLIIPAVLALAGWEYARLFRSGGNQPSAWLVALGCAALPLARAWSGFDQAPLVLSLLVMAVMAHYLVQFERGCQHAASDFAISLSGVLYVGWLGAYIISLRALPEGLGWVLLVLPGIWAADSFAYLIGSRIGRHKMTPRLSPKKSWEGYLAGIVFAVPITALFAWGYSAYAGPATAVTPLRGALVGLAMGIFPTLGDLGESMIKRQFGVKDSGALLPGHGGIFDRIDSWLWGAVIGYYLIQLFFTA
ncbi:MAG: phosphatidate cytidylyltransferase [Chloroflexota bacterium]